MRFSHKNCLFLVFAFAVLETVLGYDKCSNEFCVMKGANCKRHMSTHPFEIVVNPNPCDYEQDGKIYPGAHRAVCCDSEASKKAKIDLLALKNQARSLAGAGDNEYPHQILFRSGGICGGTVYNKEWIITAAHCVEVDGELHVKPNGDIPNSAEKAYVIAGLSHVAGAPDSNKYTIDRVITHKDYNPDKIENGSDIALLHLSRPLKLELGIIQPLRLEPANHHPKLGGKGVTIGFGNVNKLLGNASDDLMEFLAPIHSNAKAVGLSKHPLNGADTGTVPKRTQLSIGGGDSGVVIGKGDSGGPFICPDENNKPILCGVASFKTCHPFKICKRPGYFTRVAPYLDFIKKETANARQEEELLFDKPMFPDQILEEEAPSYLVRIGGEQRSCMGVLISPKMIITAAECLAANEGGRPSFYHFKTGTELKRIAELKGNRFERNISSILSNVMKQTLNKFDVAAFYLREPVEAEYAQFAPKGYQLNGEAEEYSFNPLTNYVERRHFVSLTEYDCNKRMQAVDPNVKIDVDEQLCMRQVYSAEAVCERDIGGPLMCEGGKYLCGIKTFQACKYSGMPEIFGRTAGHKTWKSIDQMIRSAP